MLNVPEEIRIEEQVAQFGLAILSEYILIYSAKGFWCAWGDRYNNTMISSW